MTSFRVRTTGSWGEGAGRRETKFIHTSLQRKLKPLGCILLVVAVVVLINLFSITSKEFLKELISLLNCWEVKLQPTWKGNKEWKFTDRANTKIRTHSGKRNSLKPSRSMLSLGSSDGICCRISCWNTGQHPTLSSIITDALSQTAVNQGIESSVLPHIL